jgi:hypothetical protein
VCDLPFVLLGYDPYSVQTRTRLTAALARAPNRGTEEGWKHPMTALDWRRSHGTDAGTDSADPATAPVWPVLAELEVYTRTRRVVGFFAPEGERTSDWINRGHELDLLATVEIPLAGERTALEQPGADARRTRISATDIVFAVPPALPSGRHLRLHRRVMSIHIEMDEYDVQGRIHVRPGAEMADYLLRSSRVFVPITDVQLTHLTEPAFSRSLPVLIVNSRHVSRLHLAEGASPRRPGIVPVPQQMPATVLSSPVLDVEPAAPDEAETDWPAAGEVHRALSELTSLHRDGLIDDAEFAAKRSEILARL